MYSIGFPVSRKENESRRALLPIDIFRVSNASFVYVEEGYGDPLGISDSEYRDAGVNVVDRNLVLSHDIICDPKAGDADYLSMLDSQTIFGWVHAVQNPDIVNSIVQGKLTAIAWEDMYEGGRHVFWRNNEVAGEAAILHAYLDHGIFPYETEVALIGRGNIARGAYKSLTSLGAKVTVYDRRSEGLLRKEVGKYDVLVNAILWDVDRDDHIIYKSDLRNMKLGAMIIDISCDRAGAVQTSVATTIDRPTYVVDGVKHYVVDHTPSLFFKTISKSLSSIVCGYLDSLIEGRSILSVESAKAIVDGEIKDSRILAFQSR